MSGRGGRRCRLASSERPHTPPAGPPPRRQEAQAEEDAKAAALKLLGMRPHSARELRDKLADRGHAAGATRSALERLQLAGLQSDAEFAEVYARSKWRQSKWGPRKIGMVRGAEEGAREGMEQGSVWQEGGRRGDLPPPRSTFYPRAPPPARPPPSHPSHALLLHRSWRGGGWPARTRSPR